MVQKPMISKSREKNIKYWQDRAERTILQAEKNGYEMVRDLKVNYEAAFKQVEKEINAFYGKYAAASGLKFEDAQTVLTRGEKKQFLKTLEEFKQAVKNKKVSDPAYELHLNKKWSTAHVTRLVELQENIRHEIEKLYAVQQTEFKGGLEATYSRAYYNTLFNIDQFNGFSGNFNALNLRVIEKAVQQKWLDKNYSSRIWTHKAGLMQNLNRTLVQGMMLGHNPRKIARSMGGLGQDEATPAKTAYNNAVRLARTEFNFVANQAVKDAYIESGVVGAYQILSTLDGRTSEICIGLDRIIFQFKAS